MRRLTLALAALAALLLLSAFSANATILFSGGEDVDFTVTGSPTANTTAGNFRSSWARLAMSTNGGSTAVPPNPGIIATFASASSDFWCHAQLLSGNANTNNDRLMTWADGSTWRLLVSGTGSTGSIKVSTRNGSGTVVDLVSSGNVVPTTLMQVDVHIVYAVAGSFDFYINGTNVLSYTGDITTNSATSLSSMSMGSFGSIANVFWSEVICATTDTRSMNRLTVFPVGNGNTQQMSSIQASPCSTSELAATSFNDANYIFDTVSNHTEECTLATPGSGSVVIPSGTYNVLALQLSARALRGTSGPQHYSYVTRTGGADYNSSNQSPGTAFANNPNYIQATNPATSSAWATTDLTAAGFNIGIQSQP